MASATTILGLLDAALCFSVALFVLFAAPGRTTNRVLAALLFFEGSTMLGAGLSVPGGIGDATWIPGMAGIFSVSVGALPALYLLVLRELDTPLVRPLRPRPVVVLLLLAAAWGAWINLANSPYPDGETSVNQATYNIVALTTLAGLVVSLHAWARTPQGSPARRRARLFALAFGVRDGLFVAFMIGALLSPASTGPRWLDAPIVLYGPLLFVPLLAYGLLRAQLLGIELVVKRSLVRAMVIATFVLVFFAASEATERLVASRYGAVGGLAAAGALAIALRPLDRIAHRLVDRAMPGIEPTVAYYDARKLELYRAALESAHESGGISEKERDSLARLQAKLGVPATEASRLEREVTGAASA